MLTKFEVCKEKFYEDKPMSSVTYFQNICIKKLEDLIKRIHFLGYLIVLL